MYCSLIPRIFLTDLPLLSNKCRVIGFEFVTTKCLWNFYHTYYGKFGYLRYLWSRLIRIYASFYLGAFLFFYIFFFGNFLFALRKLSIYIIAFNFMYYLLLVGKSITETQTYLQLKTVCNSFGTL